uniref:Uncharacterized protein n=1 Tax=Nelumbo nucifera TaxID=4432 RepID=A0A822YRG4_NELNU|nr:TPA_asm: hypothetical protein HUJ06_004791 [Nelumbo nucifera]
MPNASVSQAINFRSTLTPIPSCPCDNVVVQAKLSKSLKLGNLLSDMNRHLLLSYQALHFFMIATSSAKVIETRLKMEKRRKGR